MPCTSVLLLFLAMVVMIMVVLGMMGTEQRDWIWQYAIADEILWVLGVALAYSVFKVDISQQHRSPKEWQMPKDFEEYYHRAEQELQRLS